LTGEKQSFQLDLAAVVLAEFEGSWPYFDTPGQITLFCNRNVEVPTGQIGYVPVSPVSRTSG
jgi:hypothetical protein